MGIRILVADDHPVVMIGILETLRNYSDFSVVGQAINGDEAIQLPHALSPDVLILDINMPGLKTIQIINQITQQHLSTRVLIMTSYGDLGIVKTIMKAGATGYLLKDEDPLIIIEAVKAVFDGKIWLSPSLSEDLKDNLELKQGNGFSDREIKILQMVTQGLPNKEIAMKCGIAERTVEFYITKLFRSLQVSSRVELALWSKENIINKLQ
jgi:DNA-binding NarL/FixJ family response regulator